MRTIAMVVLTIMVSGAAYAGQQAQWGYSGARGPEHWGQLDPEFRTCAEGKNQSPIDLRSFLEAELPPIGFDYQPGGKEILNNGHTIQVNVVPGSSIMVEGRRFQLKQFHFHAPGENRIDGQSFPMEAHLVHADKDGHLAVVGVMVVAGTANASIADAWSGMPQTAGERHPLTSPVSAEGLLPSSRDYYRFNGSLTTPPCTEGVLWMVMKTPVTASASQIKQFADVMQHPNNRPVQPVHARPVLK